MGSAWHVRGALTEDMSVERLFRVNEEEQFRVIEEHLEVIGLCMMRRRKGLRGGSDK